MRRDEEISNERLENQKEIEGKRKKNLKKNKCKYNYITNYNVYFIIKSKTRIILNKNKVKRIKIQY